MERCLQTKKYLQNVYSFSFVTFLVRFSVNIINSIKMFILLMQLYIYYLCINITLFYWTSICYSVNSIASTLHSCYITDRNWEDPRRDDKFVITEDLSLFTVSNLQMGEKNQRMLPKMLRTGKKAWPPLIPVYLALHGNSVLFFYSRRSQPWPRNIT